MFLRSSAVDGDGSNTAPCCHELLSLPTSVMHDVVERSLSACALEMVWVETTPTSVAKLPADMQHFFSPSGLPSFSGMCAHWSPIPRRRDMG